MALVAGIGKPSGTKTFGDYAIAFQTTVSNAGSLYQEIHVVYDRNVDDSIKSGTRQRRTNMTRPIRWVNENSSVPLPQNWQNVLASRDNKSDLSRFLSEHIVANAPPDKIIVTGGGFLDEGEVQSSDRLGELMDVRFFKAAHEEADTCLILHCTKSSLDTIVVSARDTDVLLLLIAHATHISCTNLWMMSGTAAKRKYYNIKAIYKNLPTGSADALLPFYAITGCDTTSFIYKHSKKSAWKIFLDHYKLPSSIGEGVLTEQKKKAVEKFICKMYKLDLASVDEARVVLFSKAGKPEALPPTSDALPLHTLHAHYQSLVWKQAHCLEPLLPDPETMGWKRTDDNKLRHVLMTQDPIPKACVEIISCSCRCKKASLFCTSVCGCKKTANTNCCKNTHTK